METLAKKYETLQSILRDMKSAAVAFSAGVDSTLVLKVALDTLGKENAIAVTGRSASLASSELQDAREISQKLGAELVILDTNELDNANYASNPINRCYFCKTTLYEKMVPVIRERGIEAIVNGANADDVQDFRPGMTAANEHNVRSPALEAGLTKQDIRTLSKQLGLPTFDKPASPCLSSRVPYGDAIDANVLRMIEQAESFLHKLGFNECRVRHHKSLARVEVPKARLPELINANVANRVEKRFKEIGYEYVTFDLQGLRSGGLNDSISKEQMVTLNVTKVASGY